MESESELPEQCPVHLLKQLKQASVDRDVVDRLFYYADGIYKSQKTSKAFTYRLASTGEKLVIRTYRGFYRQSYADASKGGDSVLLVATSTSFNSPVLLGRTTTATRGKFLIYRGRQGFDESDTGLVIKVIETEGGSGGNLGPKKAKTHWKGIMKDLSSDNEDDPMDETADDRSEHNLSTSDEHTDAADRLTSATAASSRTSSTRGSIIPSTETSEGHNDTVKSECGLKRGTQGVVVCFMNTVNKVVRKKRLHACATIEALFTQAMCAKLIDPENQFAALKVKIGDEEVRLIRDDEEDFEELLQVVRAVVNADDTGDLEIYVRAL